MRAGRCVNAVAGPQSQWQPRTASLPQRSHPARLLRLPVEERSDTCSPCAVFCSGILRHDKWRYRFTPASTIDVDFDVYKQLIFRRATEQVTYNDIVRELLGLESGTSIASKSTNGQTLEDWVAKGVRFPSGTEFRASYKGKIFTARVEGGALALNGQHYDSPSAAAMSVTDSSVNGWRFWECRLPGQSSWQLIESLRR